MGLGGYHGPQVEGVELGGEDAGRHVPFNSRNISPGLRSAATVLVPRGEKGIPGMVAAHHDELTHSLVRSALPTMT